MQDVMVKFLLDVIAVMVLSAKGLPCPPNGSLGVWGREVTVVSRHSESSTPALNMGSTKEVRFAVARLYGGQLQQARQQACWFFKLKISGHLTHLTSGGRGAASIETRYNLRGEFQIQRYIQYSTVDYVHWGLPTAPR